GRLNHAANRPSRGGRGPVYDGGGRLGRTPHARPEPAGLQHPGRGRRAGGLALAYLRAAFMRGAPSFTRLVGDKAMSIATAFAEAPTYEDLIARGHALVPDFADRAARCESDCRVSDESVEQFRETGLHKTLLPAAYGGYEMGFSALLETSFSI